MENHDNSNSSKQPALHAVRCSPAPLPGPVTDVGVHLPGEDESRHARHYQAALQHFQPADPYEAFLAEQAADQSWSLARASQMVSFALYDRLLANEPKIAGQYSDISGLGKLTLAFLDSAGQPGFESLLRFEHRFAQRLALLHRLLGPRPKSPARS